MEPTKYIKPTQKPTRISTSKRRVLSKRPYLGLLLKRDPRPRRLQPKVKKLIDEITPYYQPEAIVAFKRNLEDKRVYRKVKITEKRNALNKRVKSLQVSIIERKDPAKQLYYTTPDVAKELESILYRDGGMKAQVTLHVTFKKKKN